MDIGTHALASLALARAIFPRAPKQIWAWAAGAGIVADVDVFSDFLGPANYLKWHRTYTHSLVACLAVAVFCAVIYQVLSGTELRRRLPTASVFAAALLAQILHVAMDAAQWQDVEALWPVRGTRFALAWLPTIDPWIIVILILSTLVPELFHLISSEIGAKDKRPRGQVAAIVGLLAVLMYAGVRAELHGSIVAQLQNRTYSGELPRRVGAFPEAVSLTTWHSVVETESALHRITAKAGWAHATGLDSGENLFKPEQTPNLRAAETTEAAKRCLSIARFPKASIQKTDAGEEVEIRDLRYGAAGDLTHEVAVLVDFDRAGKMVYQQLIWVNPAGSR